KYKNELIKYKHKMMHYKHRMKEYKTAMTGHRDLIEQQKQSIEQLQYLGAKDKERIDDLTNVITEYQLKLERSYDYQAIMAQDQIRLGLTNLEPEFRALYEQCREYTMTSWERLYSFYKSVQYVIENRIPGDIVECGVWRGGGMKLAAQTLLARGATDRRLY